MAKHNRDYLHHRQYQISVSILAGMVVMIDTKKIKLHGINILQKEQMKHIHTYHLFKNQKVTSTLF